MTIVLLPLQQMPHPHHSVRAANVVLFQIIRALATHKNLRLKILPVQIGDIDIDRGMPEESRGGKAILQEEGVTFLPPLVLEKPQPVWSGALRHLTYLDSRPINFYPILRQSDHTRDAAAEIGADAILTIWDEALTAAFSDCPQFKITYYGNPDPKNRRAQTLLAARLSGSADVPLRFGYLQRQLEKAHVQIIAKWDVMANVAANDAAYYAAKGHPNSSYIQNTWIDNLGPDKIQARTWPQRPVAQVIASIGRPAGTANSLGLLYLATEFLPAMRRVFGTQPFELHILGSGNPDPRLAKQLQAPEIKLRGFVDDIDAELLDKPLFLCLNNGTEYNVGHTRYLHAWSLGNCVLAHSAVREAMPELRHDENCLLGESAEAIARQVLRAHTDPQMARSLGDAGYRTFRNEFSHLRVGQQLASHLQAAPQQSH